MMNSEISTYTISVYELIENHFDFGLKDYTIFREDYRPILNKAILEYYMFREIGFMNPTVWKQKLNARLDLILRNKYNALYKGKEMDFNPLYTMELYEDYTHTVKNTNENKNTGEINYNTSSNTTSTTNENSTLDINGTSNKTNEALALSSQFPSEEMMEDDLSSNLYVDSGGRNKNTEETEDTTKQTNINNGSSNATNSGTDKTINSASTTSNGDMSETFSKKTIGSASDLSFAHGMTQFKDYVDMYDIDIQVINDLKDLFMNVW